MSENMSIEKDMVFNSQLGGIQSGGLRIKSIMLSKGLSPIMSINTDKNSNKIERVSDLFESLVIPFGLINDIRNKSSSSMYDSCKNVYDDDSNESSDDEIGNLYDKLLKLVEPEESDKLMGNDKLMGKESNELLFGGKKKNKSIKNKLNKIKGNTKSKKNIKIKIN